MDVLERDAVRVVHAVAVELDVEDDAGRALVALAERAQRGAQLALA
jgi:hypothetical protein